MRFTPLSEEREFSFPVGALDLRGWEVRTMTDGEKVGEIEDLLIDEDGALRYLDLDLGTMRKHVLVPTDRVLVDEAENVVWVPGMSHSQFEAVPSYDHDPGSLTEDYQVRLVEAYSDTWPADEESRRAAAARAHRQSVARTTTGVGTTSGEPAPVVDSGLTEEAESGPLLSLSEVGVYEVSPNDPDPRGWQVIAADRRRVGRVHDLIIDPNVMKVRYLDCEVMAPELHEHFGGRHVLIPIGYARLDTRERLVYLDALNADGFTYLPSFPGLPLAPATERKTLEIFSRGARGEDRYRS